MNQTKVKENNSSKISLCIPLIICPSCKTKIPILSLKSYEGKMAITLQCTCSKEEKEFNIEEFMIDLATNQSEDIKSNCQSEEAKKYCPKFSLLLSNNCINHQKTLRSDHVICDQNIKIECNKHKKPFSYYCKECKKNFCVECKKQHQSHCIVRLRKFIQNKEINMQIFDDIKSQNKEITNALINVIDEKINSLTKMKNELLKILNINESINDHLFLLYQSISKTASIFKENLSYEMMNLQSIELNLVKYNRKIERFEKKYDYFKQYLLTNYILRQSSVDESTSILHVNKEKCLLQLKDGKLVSGSRGNIRIWDLNYYTCENQNKQQRSILVQKLTNFSLNINSIIQLRDGRLVTCFDTIVLWNLTTNCQIKTLTGHRFSIRCLIELTDGRLASCSVDQTIKLWNITTNECVATLKGKSSFQSIVQLSDGRLVSYCNQMIHFWNITTYQCVTSLKNYNTSYFCLIQLVDGRLTYSAMDNTINLCDPIIHNKVAILVGHTKAINCLVQLIDGRLASGSEDYTLKIWNISTKNCNVTLTGHTTKILSLIQLFDGKLVSSGKAKNSIKIWDVSFSS